jgi:thioredoxin 2
VCGFSRTRGVQQQSRIVPETAAGPGRTIGSMSSLTLDDNGVIVTCSQCGQKNRIAYGRLGETVQCGKCKTPLAAPNAPIEVLSSSAFDQLVSGSSLPIVVDYWAPWCGPCRMVAPELEKVAARQAGRYLVIKVNTDDLSDLGERFGIRSIPTMAVFAAGREIARTAGARPASDIEAFVDQAVASVTRHA